MRARSTRPVASVRERAILANAQYWSGSIESVMTRRAAPSLPPAMPARCLPYLAYIAIRPYNISTIWNLCTSLDLAFTPTVGRSLAAAFVDRRVAFCQSQQGSRPAVLCRRAHRGSDERIGADRTHACDLAQHGSELSGQAGRRKGDRAGVGRTIPARRR